MSNATPGLDHAVETAALWLASTPSESHPRPIVPHLRDEFGLSPLQACRAIREAQLIRARAM